jgi:hypothetical protein
MVKCVLVGALMGIWGTLGGASAIYLSIIDTTTVDKDFGILSAGAGFGSTRGAIFIYCLAE